MKKYLIIVIILCLFPISDVISQNFSIEPTDSWVYESWKILNHYKPPDYFANQRPYWRDMLIDYSSRHFESEKTSKILQWENERLLFEKRSRPTGALNNKKTPLWLKVSPYSLNYFIDKDKPLYRFGLKAEAVMQINEQFFMQLRGRMENKGDLDSFAKVRKWEDKITGYFDYALLGYKYKSIRITWGRTFRAWGPWDNDRLLISTNSPAFDQISFEFSHKWLAFQYWTAKLDHFTDSEGTRINRFFAAHRLAFKPWKRLEIGLSETVLYGRKESGWELYYLNPILPFYWEQYNNRIDENIYMGADLTWYVRPGLIVFGELLLDDFQIDFVSEPQQIGFNIGFSEIGLVLSPQLQIALDYTQIRNTVYTQNKFYNVFANEGVVIGSSLGTDADRLRYKLTYHATPLLRIALGGQYDRKGEGRFTDVYSQGIPDQEKFPSGRVQKRSDNYLEVSVLKGAILEGYLKIGYVDIKKIDNQPGNFYSPYISLNLSYHIAHLFLL
jgi:hypothetical protein